MENFKESFVLCFCFLLLAKYGKSMEECFYPHPKQYYYLTHSAEGNYKPYEKIHYWWQTKRSLRQPNSSSGGPKGNKPPKPGKRNTEECEFEEPMTCASDAKYRTFDGSCNNLQHPHWGQAHTPLARFLKADYNDGKGSPRMFGRNGIKLPEPRDIRLIIHEKSFPFNELQGHSHFLMIWGQRTSHDMIEKVESRSETGGRLDCCGDDSGKENCEIPIRLKENDPYFGQFERTCMNFVRSKASPDMFCNTETRQQLSEFTCFIDASDLYGSNEETCENLRTKEDGLMKTQAHSDGSQLLPESSSRFCRSQAEKKCFEAGDRRVNQQAGLMSVHTLLLREHNLIAKELKSINNHWDDERIFQEARKIVIAEIQHITYESYLPKILGGGIMDIFDLRPRPPGEYFTGYDDNVIPNIRNSFMTAAFRFGHSTINDNLAFKDASGNNERTQLRHLWFNPDKLYETDGIEKVIRGLQEEHSQSVDRFKTEEVTNRMSERADRLGQGSDLISVNINRARDHATVGYLEWRKMCQLPSADNFFSLTNHSPEMIRLLRRVYRFASDIDLFVAGVTETPIQGGIVGPTFACIMGLQFKALKYGDRYFYESDDANAKFTIPQLNEIKRTTLARIVCRNSNVDEVQRDVFAHGGPTVACADIQNDLDFSLWEEIP